MFAGRFIFHSHCYFSTRLDGQEYCILQHVFFIQLKSLATCTCIFEAIKLQLRLTFNINMSVSNVSKFTVKQVHLIL